MLFETSLTAPVFGLRREMNRLLDDMMTRNMPASAWMPPVDVREDEGDITLAFELPGVRPEDVELTTDNGTLTVRGIKHAERKEGDENRFHLIERSYGSFTRQFRLPKGVDDSKIMANFENGVLQVTVPKTALPQPKRIQISGQSGSRTGGSQGQQQVTAQGQSQGQSRSGSRTTGTSGGSEVSGGQQQRVAAAPERQTTGSQS